MTAADEILARIENALIHGVFVTLNGETFTWLEVGTETKLSYNDEKQIVCTMISHDQFTLTLDNRSVTLSPSDAVALVGNLQKVLMYEGIYIVPNGDYVIDVGSHTTLPIHFKPEYHHKCFRVKSPDVINLLQGSVLDLRFVDARKHKHISVLDLGGTHVHIVRDHMNRIAEIYDEYGRYEPIGPFEPVVITDHDLHTVCTNRYIIDFREIGPLLGLKEIYLVGNFKGYKISDLLLMLLDAQGKSRIVLHEDLVAVVDSGMVTLYTHTMQPLQHIYVFKNSSSHVASVLAKYILEPTDELFNTLLESSESSDILVLATYVAANEKHKSAALKHVNNII